MRAAPKPRKPLRLTGRKLEESNDAIDSREQQRCAKCGEVVWSNGSRHHRKLRGRRGGDEASNRALLCGSGTTGCHGWAHREIAEATALGFVVASHGDPRETPILHAIHGWVLLDDEGGFEPYSGSVDEL